MAFKKGDPKPPGSGMQKGQKTKRSIDARAIFDEEDFDPIRRAIQKLKEIQDPELFVNTCVRLAKFYYPELKSIDHKIDPKELSDKELLEEAERLLREAKEQL